MGRLDGKVALISGGARGMGNAEARLFAREGARVVIGDVAAADGAALAADIGDAARFVNLDVTAYDQWESAVAETLTAFGRLDILVNNAGIVIPSPMRDLS
ncbi:MAG: SDR family NAD(P)-dependent oxidoreductase, partial [Mycobacterium sp.]